MPRVIVLNGAPGVGKTTLINELKTLLPNSYIIHEYIDVLDDAQSNLNDYLEGFMTAFDFQDYILDYYESVANCLFDSSYEYVLVERSPLEAIQVFAKLALNSNKLTQAQYNTLLQRAQSLTFYPNLLLEDGITILTDYMTLDDLTPLAEGLRQKVEDSVFEKTIKFTCSIGLTELKKGDTAQIIFDRVDHAMYEAKTGGRNRIIANV